MHRRTHRSTRSTENIGWAYAARIPVTLLGRGLPRAEFRKCLSTFAHFQSSRSPISADVSQPSQMRRSSVVRPLLSVAAKKPSGRPVAGCNLSTLETYSASHQQENRQLCQKRRLLCTTQIDLVFDVEKQVERKSADRQLLTRDDESAIWAFAPPILVSVPSLRIDQGEEGRVLHRLAGRARYRLNVIKLVHGSVWHQMKVDVEGESDVLLVVQSRCGVVCQSSVAIRLGIYVLSLVWAPLYRFSKFRSVSEC